MSNHRNTNLWRAAAMTGLLSFVSIFPVVSYGQDRSEQKGNKSAQSQPQQHAQSQQHAQQQQKAQQSQSKPQPQQKVQQSQSKPQQNQSQKSVSQQQNKPNPAGTHPQNATAQQNRSNPTSTHPQNATVQQNRSHPANAEQNRPNPTNAQQQKGFGQVPNRTNQPSNPNPRNAQAPQNMNPRDHGTRTPITTGAARGGQVYHAANGHEAHFRSDGSVQKVHAGGMDITHGPAGSRRIVSEGPGHRVIVTNNAGHGYVQRPYNFGGHEYVNRTFYSHGMPYTRVYRPIEFRGHMLNAYVPSRFYAPAFYSWTMAAWISPVHYRWGWLGDPWYGYYGGYFAPYPYYPSAAYWLTDFTMASILQASYQERLDALEGAAPPAFGPVQAGITPDVKVAIAEEIQRQLAEERAESQAGNADVVRSVAESMSDNRQHVFIVSAGLDVTTPSGGVCSISEGDVIAFHGVLPPDATGANLQVMASKPGDCPKGSWVSVAFEDLQEMQNRMRDSLDQGMEQLRNGKGGLPPVPSAAAAPPIVSPLAAAAPPPDPNAANDLATQAREATAAENEVISEATAPTEGLPVISMDQTIAEVVKILGPPSQIVNLGSKQIYVYKSMKITFIDGKIVDVQ